MIKMSLPEIIARIREKVDISEEELNKRIKTKLEQLSGLISKEGAAHIVANELGVKLFELGGRLKIKNVLAGMRDVEVVGKIQQVFDLRSFQRSDGSQGKMASFLLGDETGTIRVVLWGEQANKVAELKPEMIVKIKSGYVKGNENRKEIHLNERSKLIINPEGETVGEVKKIETKRKNIGELKENDENVEIVGYIVQVFDLKFFEICPICNVRARSRDNIFICEEHGQINPEYSYVLNLYLDDGTGYIRVVFFRDYVNKLLKLKNEDIMKFKDNPQEFDKIKSELLGNQIKVVGRINKNAMFERLEFVPQAISEANPEEEIKRLKELKDAV